MGLPCLSPLFSSLRHLFNNNEGTSWTNRCHSAQERIQMARRRKISLQMVRRHRQQPPQSPPRSHGTNSLASQQHLSTLHTTRYTPGRTGESKSNDHVYHPVVPVPSVVPARPHYIDRGCQTDLCRISLLSTDDLVFEMLLDKCRIPNGRPPPPYDPQDGF